MTEQNKQEEKNVKIFYLENMLRNKYGFNQKLSSFLSKFIVDFSENLFNDYDYEKVKHIRNAQSNIGIVAPINNSQTKITFSLIKFHLLYPIFSQATVSMACAGYDKKYLQTHCKIY